MIEVLEELDRALSAARASADANQNPGSGVYRLVLRALNSEASSIASFVTCAELALDISVDDNDPETRLLDLLCHLRHWAEANQVDFDAASRSAEQHYNVERHDPGEISFDAPDLIESDDPETASGSSDRDRLAELERLRANRSDLPQWCCPHCYGDVLMMYRPVWEMGPIDQGVHADEPCLVWTDVFDEVTDVSVEFMCPSCGRGTTQILRRAATDPVTYELWPSEEEKV